MARWAIVLALLASSGCASMMVAEQSHDMKVVRQEYTLAQALGKEYSPIQVGEAFGGFYFGIDLLSWSTLKEQPLKQSLAALVDAGLIYLAKKTLDHYDDKTEEAPPATIPPYITINIECGGDK